MIERSPFTVRWYDAAYFVDYRLPPSIVEEWIEEQKKLRNLLLFDKAFHDELKEDEEMTKIYHRRSCAFAGEMTADEENFQWDRRTCDLKDGFINRASFEIRQKLLFLKYHRYIEDQKERDDVLSNLNYRLKRSLAHVLIFRGKCENMEGLALEGWKVLNQEPDMNERTAVIE